MTGGGAAEGLRPAGTDVAARRWPWALAAVVAGAAAGAAVVLAGRRARVLDVPGAQEPDELQAVVDRVDAHR